MTFPTQFANLAAGNQPAALLDTMFNVVGAQGIIPCTASGTNAITLTPLANYYLPASYANYQIISFVASATSNGAVTIRLGALAFVNLYNSSGTQSNAGDIAINNYYIAAFNAALNSGNGGFIVLNSSVASPVQPVRGSSKNLVIQNGGTPDTQVAVTADEVMLENNSGGASKVANVSLTINTGSSGANGLDTGSMASNTFYSVWVIYNGTTAAGLLSLSATTPTLPGGYTFSARVGWVRTGAASTNLHRTLQRGTRTQYVVTPASQTTVLPVVVNTSGNAFWTAVTVSGTNSFVPTTAMRIQGVLLTGIFLAGAGPSGYCGVAPNNNYSTVGVNQPVGSLVSFATNNGNVMGFNNEIPFDFTLESTVIYYGSGSSGGASSSSLSIWCLGWEDATGT